jgi:tRNA-2-methylthio-N6-dimethylallyladenosine synthase
MTGKSDHLHAVHVTGDVAPGDLRRVRITASTSNSLAGELLA